MRRRVSFESPLRAASSFCLADLVLPGSCDPCWFAGPPTHGCWCWLLVASGAGARAHKPLLCLRLLACVQSCRASMTRQACSSQTCPRLWTSGWWMRQHLGVQAQRLPQPQHLLVRQPQNSVPLLSWALHSHGRQQRKGLGSPAPQPSSRLLQRSDILRRPMLCQMQQRRQTWDLAAGRSSARQRVRRGAPTVAPPSHPKGAGPAFTPSCSSAGQSCLAARAEEQGLWPAQGRRQQGCRRPMEQSREAQCRQSGPGRAAVCAGLRSAACCSTCAGPTSWIPRQMRDS